MLCLDFFEIGSSENTTIAIISYLDITGNRCLRGSAAENNSLLLRRFDQLRIWRPRGRRAR